MMLPHIWDNGVIGLENLPGSIKLLEEAFGDSDRVATTEQRMRVIDQKHCEFSQYYAEFQIIATNGDWHRWALRNILRMGLSEVIIDSFTSSNMHGSLPGVIMVCQKGNNQIEQ
jgi:hypothetical protein